MYSRSTVDDSGAIFFFSNIRKTFFISHFYVPTILFIVFMIETAFHLVQHTCLRSFHWVEDPTHVQLQQMASFEGTAAQEELHSVMDS